MLVVVPLVMGIVMFEFGMLAMMTTWNVTVMMAI